MAHVEVWLKLNGRSYTTTQLASEFPSASLSKFERDTLNFCRDWLAGKKDFLIETSGSTGEPKKICITREQMEASARLSAHALNLKPGFNALLALDPNYIAGKMMLVRSLVIGMNTITVEPVANPFNDIECGEADFTALVPYQVRTILQDTDSTKKLNSLKVLIVGGAALDQRSITQLQHSACEIFLTYGMTETISHIALQKISGQQKEDCFTTLPGILLEQDERDCLIIDAAPLGLQPLKTNDVVTLLSKNSFRWLGRWDNVINTGGVKVFPEKIEKEIEKIFNQLNLVNRFFVAGLPDHLLGSKVTLILEGDIDKSTIAKVKVALETTLSKYEQLREIKTVQKFIETNTQKINRQATLQLNL